jgi:integrase
MTAVEIDTPAKRLKLRPRKNPYWQGISGGRGGVSLGFRKTGKGNGVWIAKAVLDGRRMEERIGISDGAGEFPGALSYPTAVAAALAWGKRQAVIAEQMRGSEVARVAPTVRLAVETYADARKARSGKLGSETSLKLHALGDPEFANTKLAKLSAQTIEDWRAKLPAALAPSTKNRILNDLRAALNAAAVKHRRELPAHLSTEIKIGTKADPVKSTARRQLLTDAQVRAVVDASFEVDPDGDFGRLVLLAAATGARFSQLAALTVLDVQDRNSRLMMPSSRKGKNREPGARAAVPVGPDVLERLAPAVADRQSDEPLLLRWSYRQMGGPGHWTRDKRQAWGRASEIKDLWVETVKRAGVPTGTVMYALRHSSIVRGLTKNLPVRLVAALHDTSSEMIEKHYAAFIIDITEDIARQTLIEFDVQGALQAAE